MNRSLERPAPDPTARPLDRDLGFGSLALRSHYRLVNRDGSFNVRRLHESWLDHLLAYHFLVNLSWPWFFAIFSFWYLGINALFALGYLALGPAALQGSYNGPLFWRAFSSAFIPSPQWDMETSFPSRPWPTCWSRSRR